MSYFVEPEKPAKGRLRAFNTWPVSVHARYSAWYASLAGSVVFLPLGIWGHWNFLVLFALSCTLASIGWRDLRQTKHSIRRNYPIMGHLRFFLEFVRPEIRQYFFESDTDAEPFSRNQRSLVYQRAKDVVDKKAFGTQRNLYAVGAEWINHSANPIHITDPNFRVMVGGPDCTQPYSASIFNISAMSFGALSANAILALNEGAHRGGFAHDTGEGAISSYHRQFGGDLIWEIGSGYFGCRTEDGQFDPERFIKNASDPQVKMIEIKLSQGAKPGHGGVLPGSKVTEEIAKARGVPVGVDCVSPAAHKAFSTPIEMIEFVADLRRMAGGKPVGIKLCIGHVWEWFAMAKAMHQLQSYPDFIVIDGSEGGTGAAPVEFADNMGYPMQEALLLVHNTLVGLGIRDDIRLIASGKIISAYDIARTCALGADMCNSGRGFMFALGCIMAQACHTGHCPTGVTTQDKNRQAALVPQEKAARVHNFHKNTLSALADLLGSAGLTHPIQIKPHHIARRVGENQISDLTEIYDFMKPGALLQGERPGLLFKRFWDTARAESF